MCRKSARREESKNPPIVKWQESRERQRGNQTHLSLLKDSDLNFYGNIEGKELIGEKV
jgi:fatty acid/phospholipid biosynthesis enzyme